MKSVFLRLSVLVWLFSMVSLGGVESPVGMGSPEQFLSDFLSEEGSVVPKKAGIGSHFKINDLVVDFVDDRDTNQVLKIFYDDWYWLVREPLNQVNDPVFMIEHRSPSRGWPKEHNGTLDINVIRQDDQVAGFVFYFKVSAYLGRVSFLAVAPAFRRRGYGRMLLEHAIKKMFNAGCKKVSLFTLQKNPARRIYERVGFKERWHDQQDDAIFYYELVCQNFSSTF
ncbi:GNAT family N-acetyltransferase [Candidatus Dependentiae bacterium]